VLPQVVTGAFTLAAGFGVAGMNQRAQNRQRDRERLATAEAKLKGTTHCHSARGRPGSRA
jgi:hypothetical protein